MSRLLIAALAWAVLTPASGSVSDEVPCSNRVRDFYDRIQQVKRMQDLEATLATATPDSLLRSELQYQLAWAAWMADPVAYYRRCEISLISALRWNPMHFRARELALMHAIRGVERGIARSLVSAVRHARALLDHPDTQRNPGRAASVLSVCQWLDNKSQGRKALQFIASMPLSAEQMPSRFLEQTNMLGVEFTKAVWEVNDSSPEVLERIIGESVLDTLENGLELQGQRLTALMLLGQVDRAIEEYRYFLRTLTVGMEPGPEHDGTFLVVPTLELARKFEPFRQNARLQEWTRQVAKVWIQGPAQTVDWMDLLLAGRVAPHPNASRSLMRTARHAFRQSEQGKKPLYKASSDQVLHYLDALAEENAEGP